MDSARSLAQVIQEMQNEIKKLESENRALRGELSQPPSDSEPAEPGPFSPVLQKKDGAEDNPAHANLRRNVSAPALEGQFKENIIMTVRRYSISSNTLNAVRKSESEEGESNSRWARLHDGVHGRPPSGFSNPARDEHSTARERLTNRRSLQEYVNKNRAKVKTVTFLLPVDDIYTNRPVLANCRNSCDLSVIAEKDS